MVPSCLRQIQNRDERVMEKKRCVEQRPNTIQRAKAQLIKCHNKWLANNDPEEELYTRFVHVRRVERILDFTRDVQGKVLDIGCFDGFIAEKILKQGSKEVIGMDRLEKALKLAASRGIQTVLADMDDAVIDFPDNHFDCVIMGEVLDYVFDPDAVIKEVRRVLKQRGKLIITLPNLASIGNRVRMMFGHPPYALEVRPCQGGYWRYFTFDTLRALLHDHSFDIETMESNVFAFPFYLLPWVRKLFPGDQWERHRLFYSEFLARIFPRMGENIIVLAEKPVG